MDQTDGDLDGPEARSSAPELHRAEEVIPTQVEQSEPATVQRGATSCWVGTESSRSRPPMGTSALCHVVTRRPLGALLQGLGHQFRMAQGVAEDLCGMEPNPVPRLSDPVRILDPSGGAMARKMTPAQYNAWVRQENAKRKRALDAYNAEVRRVNAHNRRATAHNKQVVADYNRRARAHNDRLKREIARLARTSSTRHITYQRSVSTLRTSFGQLEAAADAPGWRGPVDLVELSESETANSVAALNSLLADSTTVPTTADEVAALRSTIITSELTSFDPELDARWRGALFSLHPDNPDASRHFCTSARELLSSLLECVAPDAEVIEADPNCPRTPQGSVSRRARVHHCLTRRGGYDAALEEFIEADLDNVLSLFTEFNSGTHGRAGQFDPTRLGAIKLRVEGAIQFVSRIASPV